MAGGDLGRHRGNAFDMTAKRQPRKVNCTMLDGQTLCRDKRVKRSLLGLGARLCRVAYGAKCSYQQENPRVYENFIDLPGNRPAPRDVTKAPGRNDKCPCLSGKKFKHCCINQIPSWLMDDWARGQRAIAAVEKHRTSQ